MTPEDIQQIVAAIEQTDWAQWVKAQMQTEAAGPGLGGEPGGELGGVPGAEPGGVPGAEAGAEAGAAAAPLPEEKKPYSAGGDDDDDDDDDARKEPALVTKYSRLQSEVGTLRQSLDKTNKMLGEERAKRINTERYSALAEKRRMRVFDLEEETKVCKYGKMTDPDFAAHLDRIDRNYQPLPHGELYVPPNSEVNIHEGPGKDAKAEKYSKECSDKARKLAEDATKRGETLSYDEALEKVVAATK